MWFWFSRNKLEDSHSGEASPSVFPPAGAAAHRTLRRSLVDLYIRSFGRGEESHLAADKSIWDECWSPGAAWRSPSPHLASVAERSPRSRLSRWTAAGEKCGQTETRADEQDQSAAGPRFTLEKPEKKNSINGPLYCFVLVKLGAQIS